MGSGQRTRTKLSKCLLYNLFSFLCPPRLGRYPLPFLLLLFHSVSGLPSFCVSPFCFLLYLLFYFHFIFFLSFFLFFFLTNMNIFFFQFSFPLGGSEPNCFQPKCMEPSSRSAFIRAKQIDLSNANELETTQTNLGKTTGQPTRQMRPDRS